MDINSVANNYSAVNTAQSQKAFENQMPKADNTANQDNIKRILDSTHDKHTVKEEDVLSAIEKANKKIQTSNMEFSFSVHEATKQIMIKVIDKESKKIIKEFPPEKILDMVAHAMEEAGLLIDEKR